MADVLKDAPLNVGALNALGTVYWRKRKLDEAKAKFERVTEIQSNNVGALNALGMIAREQDDLLTSLRHLAAARTADPKSLNSRMEHGKGLALLKRYDEAINEYNSILTENPASEAAILGLAQTLREAGRFDEAIRALEHRATLSPKSTEARLAIARILKQQGKGPDAVAAYRQLVEDAPSHVTAKIELGNLLRENDLVDDAERVLLEALAQSSDNIGAMNALGTVYWRKGEIELARSQFERVLANQPENFGALNALGLIAREQGDQATALRHFADARARNPKNAAARTEYGLSLTLIGQHDRAIQELTSVVDEFPDHRAAYLGLGRSLREIGRLEEALAAFMAADRLDPNHPSATIDTGHLLLQLGRSSDAEECFRLGLERGPRNVTKLVGLSHALSRLGRLTEAEASLREALALQPSNRSAAIALGHSLERQHRLPEAEALFASVIAQGQEIPDGLAGLGYVRRRQGRRSEALTLFRRAAASDPKSGRRLADVAIELRELGRLEEAESLLAQAVSAEPANIWIRLQQIELWRRNGRLKEAVRELQLLLEADPDNVGLMTELASAHRDAGNPFDAESWLSRALASDPGNPSALCGLGDLALQRGEPELAKGFFERAAATSPTSVPAHLGIARSYSDMRDYDAAFATLDRAMERVGGLPEFISLKIDFLKDRRDWPAAAATLAAAPDHLKGHFGLWAHGAQLAVATGEIEEAADALKASTAERTVEVAQVRFIEGQLAEASMQYAAAADHYREATRLNPANVGAWFELARVGLLNLDLDTANRALRESNRLSRAALLLRGQSLSPSQTHVGQLLDEYALDAAALEALRTARRLTAAERLEALRRTIKNHSDYTPAAVELVLALRQESLQENLQATPSSKPEDGLTSAIPPRIVQYWTDDVPEDVGTLMATWQGLNPDFQRTLFDDERAGDFLDREYGPDIARAYRRASVAAQKADIFRLAYLAARGGIYVDADNRCLAPVAGLLRPGANLVVYQERWGTLANDVIAATPEHPVIIRALELAVAAVNRGDHDFIWLATGPGLLTRAFAQEWAAQTSGGLTRRTEILDLGIVQRSIGIGCPLKYKSTQRHWVQAKSRREILRAKSVSSPPDQAPDQAPQPVPPANPEA